MNGFSSNNEQEKFHSCDWTFQEKYAQYSLEFMCFDVQSFCFLWRKTEFSCWGLVLRENFHEQTFREKKSLFKPWISFRFILERKIGPFRALNSIHFYSRSLAESKEISKKWRAKRGNEIWILLSPNRMINEIPFLSQEDVSRLESSWISAILEKNKYLIRKPWSWRSDWNKKEFVQ